MKASRRLFVLPVMLFCFTALAQNAKSAPVVVTNTTASPVPTVATGTVNTADSAARNFVRLRATKNDYAKLPSNSSDPYVVPAGKRLVVNKASFRISGPAGLEPFVALSVRSGGGGEVFADVLELLKQLYGQSSGGASFVAQLTEPLYLDAGEKLYLSFSDSSSSEYADAFGDLQGYLVDCATGCTAQQ